MKPFNICKLSSLAWRSLLMSVSVLLAFPAHAAGKSHEATFKSPQDAVEALVAAVKGGSTDSIVAVLGPKGRALASSGDTVADQAARERFQTAYEETHEIKQDGEARAVLIIGKDGFPFPIPLVAEAGSWRFDTGAGAEEILNRRIGENELATIEVMRAYVDAQREYAEVDRDGHGLQYARKLVSSDGKKDGLSWPSTEGEPESPLGPLVANARAEGYTARSGRPEPYHGYVFRILTAQGEHAPGGALDYVVHGRMIGGFGLIAAPAKYGNSGVMTFIVNQDGEVFQKDLGPETNQIAADIKMFDPDQNWRKVDAH